MHFVNTSRFHQLVVIDGCSQLAAAAQDHAPISDTTCAAVGIVDTASLKRFLSGKIKIIFTVVNRENINR